MLQFITKILVHKLKQYKRVTLVKFQFDELLQFIDDSLSILICELKHKGLPVFNVCSTYSNSFESKLNSWLDVVFQVVDENAMLRRKLQFVKHYLNIKWFKIKNQILPDKFACPAFGN
jgi:hypothetical protein